MNPTLKIPLTLSKLTTPEGLEIIYLSGAVFLCYRKEPDDPEYQLFPSDLFQIEKFPAKTEITNIIV